MLLLTGLGGHFDTQERAAAFKFMGPVYRQGKNEADFLVLLPKAGSNLSSFITQQAKPSIFCPQGGGSPLGDGILNRSRCLRAAS